MLLRDTGKYLFQHTVENLQGCTSLDRVVLATDSDEIVAAAAEVGIEALLTSREHPTGTDRVHEAVNLLERDRGQRWEVVLNVQGDEPELPHDDVASLVSAFADPELEIATLCHPIHSREEAFDPSVVKVVRDRNRDALYFSRATIPALEHPSRPRRPESAGWQGVERHVGVYAFRPDALSRFVALPRGELEATESLEQLRWLEAGRTMRVLDASQVTMGIDTEEDYAAFVARAAESKAKKGAVI